MTYPKVFCQANSSMVFIVMFLSRYTFPVVGTEVVDALTAHSWELAQAFKELRKNLFKSYLSRKVSLARCSNSQSFIHAWVCLAIPSSGTRGRVPTGDFRCGVFQSRCVVLLGWPSSSQGSSLPLKLTRSMEVRQDYSLFVSLS